MHWIYITLSTIGGEQVLWEYWDFELVELCRAAAERTADADAPSPVDGGAARGAPVPGRRGDAGRGAEGRGAPLSALPLLSSRGHGPSGPGPGPSHRGGYWHGDSGTSIFARVDLALLLSELSFHAMNSLHDSLQSFFGVKTKIKSGGLVIQLLFSFCPAVAASFKTLNVDTM